MSDSIINEAGKMAMAWCRETRQLLSDDRLTSLPDEALDHIVSLLPTNDVAVLQLVSKTLVHVFSSITSIDLDAFSTCRSRDCPILIDHFPKFRSFVNKVLLQPVDRLTHFRLCFGGDETTILWGPAEGHTHRSHTPECFPKVEPSHLNMWLSYPLAHSGLRDLELTFRLNNPDEHKLPPQLFDFPLLESFRVDANIKIDSADIPLICLPKLKLLQIRSVYFTDHDFVIRLVSSSPVLEDLCIEYCNWEKIDRMIIASHSLRRMVLILGKDLEAEELDESRTKLVTIDTPNLQYLSYGDELAYIYSITHMNDLVEATLNVDEYVLDGVETNVRSLLSFLSGFTDVQQLFLRDGSLKALFNVAESEQHLPVFRNLKTLMLGPGRAGECRWDMVLPLILHSSPLLETLVFPEGVMADFGVSVFDSRRALKNEALLEARGWRTNTLPCLTHLKRIEIGLSYALDRELNMINFFLGKAPGLKELVLCWPEHRDSFYPIYRKFPKHIPRPNLEKFSRKVGKKRQKASSSCSVIVRG